MIHNLVQDVYKKDAVLSFIVYNCTFPEESYCFTNVSNADTHFKDFNSGQLYTKEQVEDKARTTCEKLLELIDEFPIRKGQSVNLLNGGIFVVSNNKIKFAKTRKVSLDNN